MITLGDCNGCAGCDGGGGVVCDLVAFSTSTSGAPATPGQLIDTVNEGGTISFYVLRYPSCFRYLGTPSDYETNEGHPATDVIPEGQYFFDMSARDFWQNVSGVMTAVSTPSWFKVGSISVDVRLTLPECGCPHLIVDPGVQTVSFSDGSDTPVAVSFSTLCPGPPVYWGCQDQPGGTEIGAVSFENLVSTGGCFFEGQSVQIAALCTHAWANGGTGGGWQIQEYGHSGFCAAPTLGAGFLLQSHYKNLVQVIKITDGDEFHRTESDFDDNCLYLVEKRRLSTAYSDQTFEQLYGQYAGDLIEKTDTYELRRNSLLNWDFIQTYTNEYTGPQAQAQINHAAAQSASPDESYALSTHVVSGTPEYETNAAAPWDEVTTISGWGAAGSAPPYETAATGGPRKYDVDGPVQAHAEYSTLTLDARGSYSGNPEPQRIGIDVTQYEYDRGTGLHSPASVSGCIDITDSVYEIAPTQNEGRAEYVYCAPTNPPGCPLPDFVCHPGLDPCP